MTHVDVNRVQAQHVLQTVSPSMLQAIVNAGSRTGGGDIVLVRSSESPIREILASREAALTKLASDAATAAATATLPTGFTIRVTQPSPHSERLAANLVVVESPSRDVDEEVELERRFYKALVRELKQDPNPVADVVLRFR